MLGSRDNVMIYLLKTVKKQNNQILEWIRKHDRGSQVVANNTCLPYDLGVDLPLKSHEDLYTLEAYIDDKSNFNALASYFVTLGGRDFTAHTNAILKSLLSFSVAANLNFLGKRGGKEAFNDLKLRNVITCAVRKTSPSITEKEIDDKIKVWLKHAPEKLKKLGTSQ